MFNLFITIMIFPCFVGCGSRGAAAGAGGDGRGAVATLHASPAVRLSPVSMVSCPLSDCCPPRQPLLLHAAWHTHQTEDGHAHTGTAMSGQGV